jgi:ATP-dependent Clp protease ATP-binding subunit ClpX
LIDFGMIPEFVGRLPVVATLETLDRDALVRILTEPRNALTRQFQQLFAMNGKELVITPEALVTIADVALERETGVRALRAIVEDMLLDLLYELPSRKDQTRFVVDPDIVRKTKSLARGLIADPPVDPADVGEMDEEKRESA